MQPRKTIAAVLATAAATLVGVLAAPASAYTPEWGSTGSPDRVLRHGCHEYRYHYKVTVPTHDWTLETFLIDPTGDRLASGAFASESDPNRGHGTWHICKPSTRPGTFHIKAKINWYNGDTDHKGWFKPSHFRLTAP